MTLHEIVCLANVWELLNIGKLRDLVLGDAILLVEFLHAYIVWSGWIVKWVVVGAHELRGFKDKWCQQVLIYLLIRPFILIPFLRLMSAALLTLVGGGILRDDLISVPLMALSFLLWVKFLAVENAEWLVVIILFAWTVAAELRCPLGLETLFNDLLKQSPRFQALYHHACIKCLIDLPSISVKWDKGII